MQYVVVIEKTDNNYAAYVPDLPGCVAAALTKGEVRKLIKEAVELHIEGLKEQGEPVPDPITTSETVKV